MRQSVRRIGLMDHMGGGNLGDDSTQTAVMRAIGGRWRDAQIHGFSMNPSDTVARHGIPAWPIRRLTWVDPDQSERNSPHDGANGATRRGGALPRLLRRIAMLSRDKPRTIAAEIVFLVGSARIMRSLDVFVISGGGQLLDSWGGPWAYPYTICKWSLLARLCGTQCYFVNVGAGPLRHRLSKFFVRRALSQADYISFRDHDSKTLVRGIGFKGAAEVYPDCVYALDVTASPANAISATNQRTVGLSPMAWCDPRRYWDQNQPAYETFVRKIVTFGAWLAGNYRVTLFSTDAWFDSQTLEKVDVALKQATHTEETRFPGRDDTNSLDTLLSRMATMDYIITCRFHGVIFAHLMNIPVIALSHHPKVTTLMADLGLAEFCLDIETFDVAQLTAAFTRMVATTAAIKANMAEKAAQFKAALTSQFDRLFVPEIAQ